MERLAQIESLNHEGQGISHIEGKTIFIDGALPFETVQYTIYRAKPHFDKARIDQIVKKSFVRTTPRCRYFDTCGGCSMQHADSNAQVAFKQRILEDNLKYIGRTKPELILPAIFGTPWGYRHKARLSVRYVAKKETVLIGFHEKRSSLIVDMQSCEILPPHISLLLTPLRTLIGTLSIYQHLPQIELAVGANVTVLVLRIMAPLTSEDETLLRSFADKHRIQFWLQSKGLETAYPFHPLNAPALTYELPTFALTMPYYPTEFTQVNPRVNDIMVKKAMDLLAPKPNERIADLFCGIGNFSLPIARLGAHVVGVEGLPQLVSRAIDNATYNGLSHLSEFHTANLFDITRESLAQLGYFDKMLIDPPRDGAIELINALDPQKSPQRIVYISCNPATLARDTHILVGQKGYTLKACGIINMFPQTSHIESIALFERTI